MITVYTQTYVREMTQIDTAYIILYYIQNIIYSYIINIVLRCSKQMKYNIYIYTYSDDFR